MIAEGAAAYLAMQRRLACCKFATPSNTSVANLQPRRTDLLQICDPIETPAMQRGAPFPTLIPYGLPAYTTRPTPAMLQWVMLMMMTMAT